ncbi:MAG TPA: tRNA (adenosine(37)-N6)-threonylcarbamoyltransferase complex dimerization subunit type 1 TsaB [Kiritimatiellia bacterium]|nr:tRNA (adenosine(37)-N6)-threonylcarbamoyltransferase complex dimerization subunit type 1 TsaB [Kiritimatiellia bacterium]
MILAFECSTRRGQIALCEGETVLAERTWEDAAARHAAFWPALQSLRDETALRWPALDAIAVGRGPGSFSGLRAAITAARVLAAPDHLPVLAISSGEALANELVGAHAAADTLVVAGDARRGSIWYGVFGLHHGAMQQEGEWKLAPAGDFLRRLPPGAQVVTSDAERLAAAIGVPTESVIRESFPSAATVARLAWRRMQAGIQGDPVEPLYLHPPVQV